MTSIKIAEMKDLGVVIDLVMQGVEEIELPVDIDFAVIKRNIISTLEHVPTFLATKDGKAIGVASLSHSTMFFSDKPLITTNMVYVLKEHRNFATIKDIYNVIKKYADLNGMVYLDVFYGTESSKARLAESVGLKILGQTIYYKG